MCAWSFGTPQERVPNFGGKAIRGWAIHDKPHLNSRGVEMLLSFSNRLPVNTVSFSESWHGKVGFYRRGVIATSHNDAGLAIMARSQPKWRETRGIVPSFPESETMALTTIYHNPQCTKSRQTLQLLRDRGIEPKIVLYLESPPDVPELQAITEMLGIEPKELIRKKDHRDLKLPLSDDPDVLFRQMTEHPAIMERPIVVVGKEARLGRPPEQVLELL